MRENLAFGGTILLKWFIYSICGILLLPSVLEALSQSSIERIGTPLAMLVLMLVFWPICDVYIDGKYIYAQRLVKKIELSPADIEDVNYWGITGLIKMTLTKDSALGRTIIFAPHNEGVIEKDKYGDAKVFEKIGRFCGWKK